VLSVKGFRAGWGGSAGGSLSGFQRVARSRGEPEPTTVTGKKGQGRADRLRDYTVHVVRTSDQERREMTIGPGYHSKKVWQQKQEDAQKTLMRQLGWKG